ncbi:hypothetical protein P7C73_g706, partial [Tremellales sp. Uapishka_1]
MSSLPDPLSFLHTDRAPILRLPDELLKLVFDSIPDDPDYFPTTIRSVALVCQRFDAIVRPTMYQNVAIISAPAYLSFDRWVMPFPGDPDKAPWLEARRAALLETVESIYLGFDILHFRSIRTKPTAGTFPKLSAIHISNPRAYHISRYEVRRAKAVQKTILWFLLSLDCPLKHFRWFSFELDRSDVTDTPLPDDLLGPFIQGHRQLITIDITPVQEGDSHPPIHPCLLSLALYKELEMIRVDPFHLNLHYDIEDFGTHIVGLDSRIDSIVMALERRKKKVGLHIRLWAIAVEGLKDEDMAVYNDLRERGLLTIMMDPTIRDEIYDARGRNAKEWLGWVRRDGWRDTSGCEVLVNKDRDL